jgi:hypothetical protein
MRKPAGDGGFFQAFTGAFDADVDARAEPQKPAAQTGAGQGS